METLLQDEVKSNTDLRTRKSCIMSQGQHEEIQKVVEKYDRQSKEFRIEIEETMMEKKMGNQYGTQDLEEANLRFVLRLLKIIIATIIF
jgi:hypothetical protein